MRNGLYLLSVLFFMIPTLHSIEVSSCPGKAGLRQLMEGNGRFCKGLANHFTHDYCEDVVYSRKHHPFAVILSCSDASPCPEQIFDQKVEDLFVVRTPGNTIGEKELDTIERAVNSSCAPLLVVLGHQGCETVKIALHGTKEEKEQIREVLPFIERSIYVSTYDREETLTDTIQENVKNAVRTLYTHPELALAVRQGKLTIVGGCYDPHTCCVTLLP